MQCVPFISLRCEAVYAVYAVHTVYAVNAVYAVYAIYAYTFECASGKLQCVPLPVVNYSVSLLSRLGGFASELNL